eukprot:3938927-Amphidinium_carterae.1
MPITARVCSAAANVGVAPTLSKCGYAYSRERPCLLQLIEPVTGRRESILVAVTFSKNVSILDVVPK